VRPDPFATTLNVWRERYAGARVVFLAGSVMRGEATPESDLDIVVVYERLECARRESFVSGGWPVEAFVHDPETAAHFFEVDRRRGIPSLMRMVLEGVEVPGPSDFSARMKRRAERVYEAGPPRWDEGEVRHMRYRLTDWVDDIRHPRAPEELVATGAYLYQDLADFFLRARGLWSAHSKTIPRRLREVDAAFAQNFAGAFEALFAAKRPGPAIALVEETLAPYGGLLFEGYTLNSRPDERRPSEDD
jgi:predicted nucleotidyltransferase